MHTLQEIKLGKGQRINEAALLQTKQFSMQLRDLLP